MILKRRFRVLKLIERQYRSREALATLPPVRAAYARPRRASAKRFRRAVGYPLDTAGIRQWRSGAVKVYASVHPSIKHGRGWKRQGRLRAPARAWERLGAPGRAWGRVDGAVKVCASVHPFMNCGRSAQSLRVSPPVHEFWIPIARAKAQRGERERRLEAPENAWRRLGALGSV